MSEFKPIEALSMIAFVLESGQHNFAKLDSGIKRWFVESVKLFTSYEVGSLNEAFEIPPTKHINAKRKEYWLKPLAAMKVATLHRDDPKSYPLSDLTFEYVAKYISDIDDDFKIGKTFVSNAYYKLKDKITIDYPPLETSKKV